MAKYKGAEEDEFDKVARTVRGWFNRPPPPIAIELKLNRGDEGEQQVLRMEREDLSAMESADIIAENLFDEAKLMSDRLQGTNRFSLYMYREGYKDGRRAHGSFLFKIESAEDESIESMIQRSEPLNEKGFTQAMMRLFLEKDRTSAAREDRLNRHIESMFGQLASVNQRMAEQQVQLWEVMNSALDRKAERDLMVKREERKDQYADIAAKQVFPLIGPLMGKVLHKFGLTPDAKQMGDGAAPGKETQITYQLIQLLNTFEKEQADKFLGLLDEKQTELFKGRILPLVGKRSDTTVDMEIACLFFDFIYSFDETMVPKLTQIVNQAQAAAFMELFQLVQSFKDEREKQMGKKEAAE